MRERLWERLWAVGCGLWAVGCGEEKRGCGLSAVGCRVGFLFFFFFFFVLRNLQPTAYSPQPVTRYRPGGGQGVGNGNADAQAALVKLAQHALGQGRFASFQRADAGHVDQQALRLGPFFQGDRRPEPLTPRGQQFQSRAIAQRVGQLEEEAGGCKFTRRAGGVSPRAGSQRRGARMLCVLKM